ncbi:hypothetical protein F5B17DRAFT_445758 [Nemania serpens]|nr:hypothetical protein F5B17DRAFT_445758 [Nemania serpens]
MPAEADAAPRLCARCKEHDGVLDLRSEAVCRTCFASFVASKAIKRLEVLQRETRGPRLPARPQRYLLALSRGPSSTALLHVLGENVRRQRERNQRAKFELVVVFVDVDVDGHSYSHDDDVDGGRTEQQQLKKTSTSAAVDPVHPAAHLNGTDTSTATATATSPSSSKPTSTSTSTSTDTDPFTAHFPELTLHTLPLSTILSSRTIDWSALPSQDPDPHPAQTPSPKSSPPARLSTLLSRLPSPAARADVTRLLIRHALFAAAESHGCAVVLLGHNTTSLAELTLSEAAKGRGFGVPWLVNDGAFPLPRAVDDDDEDPSITSITPASVPAPTATTMTTNGEKSSSEAQTQIQIYSPLREVFRKEILTYLSITHTPNNIGPLSSLFPSLSVSPSIPSLLSPSPPQPQQQKQRAIVSHRDLSLDDVVARYFADVEASYPSVVANVVRTTGKLSRYPATTTSVEFDADSRIGTGTGVGVGVGVGGRRQCGLCGVRMDPLGDERWKGEIGLVDATADGNGDGDGIRAGSGSGSARLCYGCDRSVKG